MLICSVHRTTISRASFTSPGIGVTPASPAIRRRLLDLDFPEVKVWLDAQGKPLRLEKIENDISHQLIEELMLLANELVATRADAPPTTLPLSCPRNPDADELLEFRETALGLWNPLR